MAKDEIRRDDQKQSQHGGKVDLDKQNDKAGQPSDRLKQQGDWQRNRNNPDQQQQEQVRRDRMQQGSTEEQRHIDMGRQRDQHI